MRDEPLRNLKGIGEKTEKLFAKVGVTTSDRHKMRGTGKDHSQPFGEGEYEKIRDPAGTHGGDSQTPADLV